MRIKCLRILPEMCASTWCWLSSNSTRNIAFGRVSRTFAITSIASSFAITSTVRILRPLANCTYYHRPTTFAKPRALDASLALRADYRHRLRLGLDHAGEDFGAVLGDGDGVLTVRAGAPVQGHDRPAVLEDFGLVRAQIYHRLD